MTERTGPLERRVEGVRGHLLRRGAIATALWVAVGAGLLWIAAWASVGEGGWRQGSDVPALIDVAVLAWGVVGLVVFRFTARRRLAEGPLSAVIEGAAGLGAGTVRGALELARSLPVGVSAGLAAGAAARAATDLAAHPAGELAGPLGVWTATWTRRGLGVLGALAVLVVTLAVLTPERTSETWRGVASPLSTMIDPVLPPLVVRPGTVEVMRGSDVQLEIEASGRAMVTVEWQAAGDVARREALQVLEGRAAHVFEAVSAPIEYRVRGDDGAVTGTLHIVPIDPLFVSDLVIGVEYPAYTGLPPDEYRGDPPPLRLPRGTRLVLEGRASRSLASGELLDATGATAVRLAVDGASFRATWTPRVEGTFDWMFLDTSQASAEIVPGPIELLLVADSVPRVVIPMPGADTVLPLDLRQPLILEARDDYGLATLELVAYRVTAFGDRQEPVVQGLELGGSRSVLARSLLDVSGWGLLPGDVVHYFARATDNSPVAQAAVSREYVLRMPSATELRREAAMRLDEVSQRLEDLGVEAARQAEENRDQARKEEGARQTRSGSDATPTDFERRQELERALEGQEALTAAVDSLRAELESLEERMEEAGQADAGLRRTLDELQGLMEELADEELAEGMQDLAQALENENLREAGRSLESLAQEQERFRERLEQSLEQLKRAAVEQDFRATTGEAEELARQEEALADAMNEADRPALRGEQQEALADRAEALEADMERLQQRLGELGEESAAEGVQEARERAAEAREQMQRAGDQARQGESSEAADRAEQAAEQMREAAAELGDAQQEQAQQQAEATQRALQQAGDDALALARRQNELREQMRGTNPNRMDEMRAPEASLLQGIENLAQNLQEATDGALDGQRELSAQMGRAMESVQQTLSALEGQPGGAPSPFAQSEQAVAALNRLALMAMAGAEQMGQQGQGQGQSGGELSEQLQNLAQQQGGLMDQAGQLMPLQLGEEAMAQQLQRLSQSQESVSRDLETLAQEPSAEEALGDLEQLALEAEALARALAEGRLTPETVQRQERLFHRLLDAGRSLEREEFSEERESQQPGYFERGSVLPLGAGQLGAMLYELPEGEQLRSLSPAVRQLVLDYFERLNGRGSSGGGP